jgi:hypothetical protein
MGVEPGNWQAINPTTYGKRILQARESAAAERLINLAYARLKAKIAAGKTWTIIDSVGDAITVPG